jgi:hypothetical protein
LYSDKGKCNDINRIGGCPMNEIKKKFDQVVKIQNGVYCIEKKQRKYIVKISKPSLVALMIDHIRDGRHIAFENEINFYLSLNNRLCHYFHYPKLVKTDGRNYIMMEYIAGSKGWDNRLVSKESLIKALLEFQRLSIDMKSNCFKHILNLWHRKIPCKILRWSFAIIRTPYDLITLIRCLRLTLYYSVLIKPTDPILVHNDLFYFNNLITGLNHRLYFYDFEYVIKENKWILIDILDISFDLLTLTLRSDLLAEYRKQISDNTTIHHYILTNAEALTRVILIRKILGALLTSNTEPSLKSEQRKFLDRILLSDKEYKEWYQKNMKPYITGTLPTGSIDDLDYNKLY